MVWRREGQWAAHHPFAVRLEGHPGGLHEEHPEARHELPEELLEAGSWRERLRTSAQIEP